MSFSFRHLVTGGQWQTVHTLLILEKLFGMVRHSHFALWLPRVMFCNYVASKCAYSAMMSVHGHTYEVILFYHWLAHQHKNRKAIFNLIKQLGECIFLE